jgi:hypothetical protein
MAHQEWLEDKLIRIVLQAAQLSFALHLITDPQAGGRDCGEPLLVLMPF